MTKKKAIAYIDGLNLYHGVIDRKNIPSKGYKPFSAERPWGDLLWLNLESFINSYRIPNLELIKIKFFQAPSYKPDSLTRQQVYQNALLSLKTIDESSFFFGEFRPNISRCSNCGYEHVHYIEKRTDAAMSTEILSDFFLNNCDAIIIVGGDSDQIPVIEKIRALNPAKDVYVIFPPSRKSKAIYQMLGQKYCRNISHKMLVNNQLPDTLEVNGFKIEKPQEYRRQIP